MRRFTRPVLYAGIQYEAGDSVPVGVPEYTLWQWVDAGTVTAATEGQEPQRMPRAARLAVTVTAVQSSDGDPDAKPGKVRRRR